MTVQQKVKEFFASYPERVFEKGEVIIHPGPTTKVFYVSQGVVTQYDISGSGDKLVVNLYKAGAFLPLASAINHIPENFFFEAAESVIVRQAPSADVVKFLVKNSDVTFDALARVSRGSGGLMQRLAKMMEGGAEARIIQELEIMQARFGDGKQGVVITEARLAEQTGLARETVSRALKRLKADDIVTMGRGRITIND